MSLVPFHRTHTPSRRTSGFDEFDRIFDNFFKNALTNINAPTLSVTDLAVKLDVSETDTSYLIHAELPGVAEDEIELTLSENVLTLSGEKQQESEEEGKNFHRVERNYGSFKRVMQLPSDADEGSVSAKMKNGVLNIEIGKVKEAEKETKRIKIGK